MKRLMKRLLPILSAALLSCFSSFAQVMNPECLHHDIEVGVGIQVAPNMNTGADLRLDLSYGYFFRNGIGFRTGATYTPNMFELGKAVGLPISFAWRTFKLDKSYSNDTFHFDGYDSDHMLNQDYPDYVKEQFVSGFASFLTQIASNIETDAGLTPGYLKGNIADSFYMTGDLGLRTSWRIWHFNFTVNPAIHYLLTNKINMGTYKRIFTPRERWQVSLMFGVSFML